MPLIDLTTNLRDLKFGRDRVAGGSSNQPYVQSDIPALDKESSGLGYLNQDFVVRGGLKAVVNSVKDVERLSKYFFDVRNPSGLLFIAKQNLLSRLAVKTQASKLLNEGVYTPIGTLAQAGGVAFGLHTNKQGLNPFENFRVGAGATDPTSLGGYFFAVTETNTSKLKPTTSTAEDKRNRLLGLFNDLMLVENKDNQTIQSYPGGPGSPLGIGKTNIMFASERTGINSKNKYIYSTGKPYREDFKDISYNIATTQNGVKNKYYQATNLSIKDAASNPSSIWDSTNGTFVYTEENLIPVGGNKLVTGELADAKTSNNRTRTFSQKDILTIPSIVPSDPNLGTSFLISNTTYTTAIGDFRRNLRNKFGIKGTGSNQSFKDTTITDSAQIAGNLAAAPNYYDKNIENRVFLGNPGDRNGKNLLSYTQGFDGTGAASPASVDLINASKVGSEFINDLVKFRIQVIDNDTPSSTTNIQFRAFLDNISDSFSADWKGEKYVGRGENFYNYSGFDRKVSLSWTVAAQSKKELIPMYKKLSYLASICAPDYSKTGYMRGNIVKLTIGGYFFEQPGIITGFSYEMNEDNATWEIGIDDDGGYDSSVKELPHLIKVKGFNFIPIHTFTPQLGKWENSPFIALTVKSKPQPIPTDSPTNKKDEVVVVENTNVETVDLPSGMTSFDPLNNQ